MTEKKVRAEIVVSGLVQGVGYRYFVLRTAEQFGVKGYVKNLYTGDVYTVVEGEKHRVDEFFKKLKIGPMYSDFREASINITEYKNEFTRFEIKY